MDKNERDVLTRKEIIEVWDLDKRYHDYFCCPECRSILTLRSNGLLFCENTHCDCQEYFTLEGKKSYK